MYRNGVDGAGDGGVSDYWDEVLVLFYPTLPLLPLLLLVQLVSI